MESSLFVRERDQSLLFDVTRDFDEQCGEIDQLSAIALTHAHRDASGGFARLRRWWRQRPLEPIPVLAGAATIKAMRDRFERLDHCRFEEVQAGQERRLGAIAISSVEVPHARERRYPTFAWRLVAERSLVYASDVAELTDDLARHCAGADLLIIDGAMWRRHLFSHLTIDEELPRLCEWPVDRILLTQIGRTAPPHSSLEREVASLCPRAEPAYDGLGLEL